MMMTAFQLRLETIMDLRQFHLEEQEMLLILEEEETEKFRLNTTTGRGQSLSNY